MKKLLSIILTLTIFFTMAYIQPFTVSATDAVSDSSVFLKQAKGSSTCTLVSSAMMLRRRAYLEGNSNWSSITESSLKSTAWSGGLKWDFTYAGMRVIADSFASMTQAQKKSKLLSLLSEHPEGIVIYMYGDGKKTHAVLATDYDASTGTIYCADPASGIASGRIPLTSAYLTGNNQNERIGNLRMYWYVKSGNCNLTIPAPEPTPAPPTHSHVYSYSYDSAHPHSEYKYCSCESKEYTGTKKLISSCQKCYPLGSVKFTRSFKKTDGEVTFYRGTGSNVTSYNVTIYKDGRSYTSFNMTSISKTLYDLPSGKYTATLTIKNSNTGEQKSIDCDSFEFKETYNIYYNANGGSGAPSTDEKIQDTNKTLSSKVPTRAHYIFKGWARSKNATTAEYQPGDTYSRNTQVTLYAVWEPETYTIKFDANGGKGEIADKTITYGDTIRIPNDVICDYSYLKGWSTSKTSTTAIYKIGMDYKFDANMTLYAVWGASSWSGGTSASLSGSGTEVDPYLIQSEADLGYLANKVNSQTAAPVYAYYKLTNNINLAYNEWVPIGLYGNTNQYFYGSFDGNGFTISDLYITNENEKNIGLFGYVKDSEIKNLTVTGAIESITSSNALNIGAIAGYAENTVLNKLNTMYFNIGSISVGTTDYTRMGTIAGYVSGGTVSDCISTDSHIDLKSGKFEVGMIAGYSDADITDCSAKSTTGGLFSTQTTVGEFRLGGLCGNLSANAERCSVYAPYLSNNIKTTSTSSVGGLVGYLDGEVKVCSSQFNDETANTITINGTGSTEIGGIAGFATNNAKITDCKFDGNSVTSTTTSGSTAVGGLVGSAQAKTTSTIGVQLNYTLKKEMLPVKKGYIATWYTDVAMTTPYDFSQTVTSDITLYAKWEEGDNAPDIWDGTSKEPSFNADTKTYTITNGEELAWVSDVTNGVITNGTNFPSNVTFSGYTVELANDIYLNDISDWESWEKSAPINQWNPIGKINKFEGTFDGKNHTISGIYVKYFDNGYVIYGTGFFSSTHGTLRNLNISDSYFYSNRGNIGAFVGYCVGDIYDCFNLKNVIVHGNGASADVGGIIGCGDYAGNIQSVGNLSETILIKGQGRMNSSVSGSVGGIAGSFLNESTDVYYCFNYATVEAEGGAIGGIAGAAGSASIEYAANYGKVISKTNDNDIILIGGITGYSNGDICNVYNVGDISVGANSKMVGGICGRVGKGANIERAYSTTIISNANIKTNYRGNLIGQVSGSSNSNDGGWVYLNELYAIQSPTYHTETNYSYGITVRDVQVKTNEQLKNDTNILSKFTRDERYNDGFPIYESIYSCKVVLMEEDTSAINRSFANINGNLTGNGSNNANVGGILGSASGSSGANSVAQNVITIADGISSSHKAGNIVANNSGYFTFDNAYYNTEMNVTSSSNTIDTTGTARSEISMNVPFYTNLLGLTPYTSLSNIANDNKAVWVLKNGKLPELYYNCLNDITISDDIENGSVTVDKTKAVDGEVVTVTVAPNEGYVLNKVYVDGVEQDGETFIVSGNDEVYVTFAEKIAEYDVTVETNANASATLSNADDSDIQLLSASSSLKANDGNEIKVNVGTSTNYALDTILVNGEEITSDSFILTADSIVTMKVTDISTDVKAETNTAEDVGDYFAVVSGLVSGNTEGISRYIRYWSADDINTIYTTDVEAGTGEYSSVLMDLKPETKYYYQMTEYGEVKSFTTLSSPEDDFDSDNEEDIPDDISPTPAESITNTTITKLSSGYLVSITSSQSLIGKKLFIVFYNSNDAIINIKSLNGTAENSYALATENLSAKYARVFAIDLTAFTPVAGVELVTVPN